jgi:hypothetical protein
MTTTLQRLDVVQVFTDIDGTGKTWNDYCTIKEQGDEGRALELSLIHISEPTRQP